MRRSSPLLLLMTLWVSFFSLVTASSSTLTNVKIDRTIHLSKYIVAEKTSYSYQSTAAVTSYQVMLPLSLLPHLSLISATCDGHACDVTGPTRHDQVAVYTISGLSPATTSGTIELMCRYTHVLIPYPATITQSESQFVLFESFGYTVLSPYPTTTHTTTLLLPENPQVRHFSKPIVPSARAEKNGRKLVYGPYSDLSATVATTALALTPESTVSVHFRHHAPFFSVTNLVKEIEVSMWGRVSVEEVYDLMHRGSILTGGFSRLDYDMSQNRRQDVPSIATLSATLPVDADHVYYRDIIGNVTTSRLRVAKDHQWFVIEPRFPLFGGWKTQWYWGYTLPTASVLSHVGSTYSLSIPFSSPLTDATVDQLVTKVILPEGAKHAKSTIPFDIESSSTTLRKTYLDSSLIGRPVLIFKTANLVPHHNVPCLVTFEFERKYMLHEFGLLFASYFSLFLFAMGLLRLNLNLSPTTTTATSLGKAKPKSE